VKNGRHGIGSTMHITACLELMGAEASSFVEKSWWNIFSEQQVSEAVMVTP
jgi:hypothetical protein